MTYQIHSEYSYGIMKFKEELEMSLTNITETEIEFLSQNINTLILYGESLMHKSMTLFNTFGFIVDAKSVYLFVAGIRNRIKANINLLIQQQSSNDIKENLEVLYKLHIYELNAIVEKEILSIRNAVERNEELIECWDSYKVLIFELGLDVVGDMTSLSLTQSIYLMATLETMKREIMTSLSQLLSDLSRSYSSVFLTRLQLDSFVSSKRSYSSATYLSTTKIETISKCAL